MDMTDEAKIERRLSQASMWKREFSWLCYDEEAGVMNCYVCSEIYGKGGDRYKHMFVIGCSNFRKSSVKDHDSSSAHRKAQAAYMDAKSRLIERPVM